MDSKDINERRRGDLDKFLTTTNTKAAVFRDIIIESGTMYRRRECTHEVGYQSIPRTFFLRKSGSLGAYDIQTVEESRSRLSQTSCTTSSSLSFGEAHVHLGLPRPIFALHMARIISCG